MRKLTLFFACMLMAFLGIGQVWGATADVTYDFTASGWTVSSGTLSNGTASFTGAGSANFKMNSGYFMMGKSGAYINFPTYTSAVSKIVVTGNSGGSASTKMNIYVGETAVSTETTGSAGTNTYEIASASQAAGTTYTLKVTSAHNAQITKIEVFYAGGTPTCATPTFDPEDGETFTDDIDVEIASTTDGATIYYTIDGNDPTTSSDVYSTALNFTETTTLKAMAVKEGSNNSEIATATYTKVVPFSGSILEIVKGDFTTSSYDDNAGDHEKSGITFTTAKVYQSGGGIQFQKTNGLLYNKTDLGEIAKIEITTVSGKSNNLVVYSGTTENPTSGAVTGSTSGSVTTYTFASGKGFFAIKCNSTGASNVDPIKVYYTPATPSAVAKPTISGDENFVTSTTVTISHADADHIYYTTNGDAPTTSSAEYTVPFSLTNTATVKAIAVKGGDESDVAEKTFTKVTALTTMDAIFAAASTAGNYYITFSDSWVVTGVSTNGKNVYITDGTKGMILFNNSGSMGLTAGNTLSGTVERSLKLYNGAAELDGFTTDGLTIGTASLPAVQELDAEGIAGLSGVNTGSLIKISGECTEESSKFYIGGVQLYNSLYAFSVSAGTSYECTGVYVQYNSTKEVLPRSAADIVASATIAVTGVDLTESTASVEVGETVTLHASVVPSTATNKTIVWSVQSGSDKASVADGVVTGLAAGEAVIRAASDEDATLYDECIVTVTAADPTKHVVTFDATVDKGESPLSKSNITFTCSSGVLNNESEYRLYKSSTTTFACSVGNITKIEFTGVSGNPVSGFGDPEVGALVTEGNNGVWTGNAESVSFVASGAQVRATEIVVTYKEDNRAEAGLAWNPADDIEITVGDAFSAPALNNPNSIDAAEISIESSNTSLATVTAGVVALVTDATGEATITATFAGNATYKPATISYKITVNGAPLTDYYEKVTSGTVAEGTYLIVYEEGSLAFNGGLATLDAESNTIAVDITSDNKIAVTSATEAAAFYIDPTAGTVKSASGNFIGVGSWSNGLKQDKEYAHNVLEIDGDGNAQIGIYNADWNTTGGTMRLQYNKSSGQTRFRYYKNGGQQSIALYKLANEVIKPAAGLAWDPADDIEITVGDAFTPRTLLNPNNIDDSEITIESSNTDLATVTAGVVSLVDAATGTATITATFAGNTSYKPATISYKIKVNAASSIYVSPSLNVNFSSVVKDAALPTDQKIIVTLNNVAAATATLGGTNPEAFSIDPATLTASGDITISVVSSATVGEFKATLTISDDASVAASKEVKLSFTVTEPSSEETPISTSTKWVAATEIADGMQVLITGVKDEVVYAMGEQKSTNRAAYVATIDGEGVLTPGEGTMAFTLVAQGDGTYAIRTSNGKYLYAAKNDANHLKTQDEVDVNAKWTLTVASAVAASSTNRNVMQFNGGSSKLFSCYASASQSAIQFYVPKPVTPPTPVYTDVRTGLTAGKYYTICHNKQMTAIKGATLWEFESKDASFAYIVKANAPYVAGRPYIIYAESEKLEAVEGSEVSAPNNTETNGLYGTFSQLEQSDFDNIATTTGKDVYFIYNTDGENSELRQVNGQTGNWIRANRAYVIVAEIPDGTPAPMPGRQVRSMSLPKNTPTGMDQITNDQLQMSNKVIINGHLYIIRGEKMYDATGRLVK